MKKTLLFGALTALSMGAFAQITPSPFWTNQNSNFPNVSVGIRYMDVVSPSAVWCVGYDGTAPNRNTNEFQRTTNSGTTYTAGLIYPDTITYHPSSIEGIDANTAWVVSYLNTTGNKGAIHTTTNGGVTWTNKTPVNMFTSNTSFGNITCFFTPSVGIVMGDPVAGEYEIHRTTDGGNTWTAIAGSVIPNPSGSGEFGLTDVFTKYGTSDVWFGTNLGRVYHSSDAGLTWSVASIGATPYVNDIAFRDAMNGILLTNAGTAYRTNNGGASWTQITPIDPNMGKNSISAIPGTNLFASCGAGTGNNVISYSSDDGATWTSWGGANVQYLEIEFFNNMDGYAGGFSDPMNAGVDGMFKYSGVALGVNNAFIPYATLEMYPNPSTGLVTLDLAPSKAGATINVIDVTGKIVHSENVKNGSFEKYTLNLSDLAKGIYSINVIRPTGTETSKVIIQ